MRIGMWRAAAASIAGLMVAGIGVGAARAPQGREASPRLVVLLIVDQFSASHVNLYRHQWSHGLKRLFDTGAYFPLAAYPYGYTVTCVGHASISTGTLPVTHGIAGNDWYDRQLGRRVTCTEDPTAGAIGFGGGRGTEHHGPASWRALTFSEELRAQAARPPRVVALSAKPRSAISLAGSAAPETLAVWAEADGTWATSDAYGDTPWPDVDEFVGARPLTAAYGSSWTRLLPDSAYLFDDDGAGEPEPRTFPHVLTSRAGVVDRAFFNTWMRSPFGDAFLGDLAISLVEKLGLGQQPGTDFLGVSFSGPDAVGHAYGPRSHEVQDMFARLDVLLGRLFDTLDRTVGPGRYTVALSADHGVTLVPEQAAALGLDAGRISTGRAREAVEQALTPLLGAGPHVVSFGVPYVYFAPGVAARIESMPEARKAVEEALLAQPGIARAYWAGELNGSAPTSDALLHAMRLSYVADRSGDIALVPKPYWMAGATGATHGSPYAYDRAVPVLFMGAGIRAGRYLSPATPIDIAPTLAAIAGIRMSETDGHVLTEALER